MNSGTHKAIIATTQQNEVVLLKSDPDAIEQGVLEDCFLDDYIDNLEPGKVYSCTIRWNCFQSNHPLDPVEWDVEVFIENLKEINIDNG